MLYSRRSLRSILTMKFLISPKTKTGITRLSRPRYSICSIMSSLNMSSSKSFTFFLSKNFQAPNKLNRTKRNTRMSFKIYTQLKSNTRSRLQPRKTSTMRSDTSFLTKPRSKSPYKKQEKYWNRREQKLRL